MEYLKFAGGKRGRNKSQRVHGSHELAKKIERKKMSLRDENGILPLKREVNF
jgi:hypothetical protein